MRLRTLALLGFTYAFAVSAAAQTNGVGNSVWRTELTLFNAGNDAAMVHQDVSTYVNQK